MDGIQTFIPIDRIHALARGEELPDRARGAALFADVSGFTALTGALARELGRKRGAEQLLVHVNQVYERLVTPVHAQGGAVVSFAGDAITCWFDDSLAGHPTADAGASRAWTAARSMQRALGTLPPVATEAGEVIRLGVKIGIAAGRARRFTVGDPSLQRIDTLAGHTLTRVAQMERLAGVGEIRCDPPMDAAVDTAPAPWPSIPALTGEQLAGWVIPDVAERIGAGLDFLTELRPAVPIFVGFEGIDYDDDPNAGARLDAWLRWAQVTLSEFGGTLVHLLIGDKGSSLYASFGAPRSHEDDLDRACAAALALLRRPPALDFVSSTRIGIAQGQVWSGACGAAARRCYTVTGEPVNLAARLMAQAAPGQILVQERVARGAGRHRFGPLESLKVRGQQEPERVAALEGPRVTAAPSSAAPAERPIVGRAAELGELEGLLDRLAEGGSGTALIEGEAGIGKSRLIGAFLEGCGERGQSVLVGLGDSVERNRPYQAWRPVFASLLAAELADSEPHARLRDRVAALDPTLEPLAALLNPVLPGPLPESPELQRMDASVRAERTRDLLVRVLAADPAPMVIVLEDAHWIDSASWGVATALGAVDRPLLRVVASRPLADAAREGAQHEALVDLASDPRTVRLRLAPLAPDDALALACGRLGVLTLPPAAARVVVERAEGNPLFLEELVLAMSEAGVLRVEDDHGVLVDADTTMADFPDTLEGLVTSRLDRLSPAAQRAAKVGSVLGRVFELEPLQAVHPLPEELGTLSDSLAQLERLDITRSESGGGASWTFKHAITHEVVYGTLTFAQRQTLHRAVATWYQERHADDLTPFYPLLAHHWERADAPQEALDFGERAGEQALRSFANREAVAFFEPVVARLEKGQGGGERVRHVRSLRRLAEGLFYSGDVPRAGERLRELFELSGHPLPASSVRAAGALLLAILRQVGHRQVPRIFLRTADSDVEEMAELARALALLTYTYYYTGDFVGAFLANFRGLNLAELAGETPDLTHVLANAYTNVGAVCRNIFLMPKTAEAYFRRADRVAEAGDEPSALAYVDQVRGMVALSVGETRSVEEPLHRSARRFEALGNWRKWEEVRFTYSNHLLHRGDLAGSEAVGREIERSSRRRESTQSLLLVLAHLGHVLGLQGRDAEAEATLAEALALHAREPYYAERTYVNGALALLLARAGRREEAQASLAEVRRLIRLERANPVGVEGYAAAAQAALTLHRATADPDLIAAAREALAPLAQLATVGSIVYRSRVGYLRGLLAEAHGRRRSAVRRWRAAVDHAVARELGLTEALASVELAVATSDPAERERFAARARSLAQSMPAPWLLSHLVPPPPIENGEHAA